MKVFLSSVIAGFTAYREAAAEAIGTLDHEVVRSEQFAASADSPQVACLAGIRQSDAVVVVLGERYGPIQSSGLSATHEEFREAKATKPTLVFVQAEVAPEPAQAELIEEARDWGAGGYAPSFSSSDDLKREIVRGLHGLELAKAAGPVDQEEMLARALERVPDPRHTSGDASLAMTQVGGPRQAILRPAELEDPQLARDLTQEILFGSAALFDAADGTTSGMSGNSLVIKQARAWLALDAEGTTVVVRPIHRADARALGLSAVIEEDVRDDLEQTLRFVDRVLERVDPTRRLTHVVPVAALIGATYGAWRTRAEQAASPNSMSLNIDRAERPLARLSPPARPRQALHHQTAELAKDLAVLLRRAAIRS